MIEDIQNSQIRWEISRRKLLIAREALKAAQKTVKNLESQTNDLYQSYKLTLSSSLNAVVSYSAPTPLQIKAMNIVNSFKIIDEPTMKTPPKKLKQIEAPSIRSPGLSPKISDSPNFDTQIKVLKLQPYKAPFAKKIILKPEPYLKDISYHRILGYLTRHEKRIKNFEFNLNQQSRSWLNNPLTTLIFLFKIDSTLDISTLKCIVNNSQLQVPKKSDLLLDYYSFTLSTALSNLLDGVNKLIISRAIQIGFVAIVENESANDLCKMVINHKDYQLPESESLNLIKVIDLVHLFDLTHDGSRVLVPVRGSTCSHANVFCLVKWLIRGSNTCPICFKVVDLHSQSDSLIMVCLFNQA